MVYELWDEIPFFYNLLTKSYRSQWSDEKLKIDYKKLDIPTCQQSY